ncbi:MAG TPA: sel1 repeat family protein [Dokdonella sp.]
MHTRRLVAVSVMCIATALAANGLANAAADALPEYSPGLKTPNQRFTAPEDSARPGETFFYRAASAVSKQDYAFALDMYRVSASWAFKPAQYNLGVMYFNGEGVPVDRARGLAWLALAAERGDGDYIAARDRAYAELSADEFARANALWRELKDTYADPVALKRAANRWLQVRRAATGSHLGENLGHLAVGGGGRPGADSGRMMTTGFDLSGAGGVDGSMAYRRLNATNNPYDVKLEQPTGTTQVGDVIPVGDAGGTAPPNAGPSTNHPDFY